MTTLTTPGTTSAVAPVELLDDRYRLVTLLHRANDIETWQAHDVRLNRDVTVELIPPVLRLEEMLSTRYSERVQVYDAGSHSWRGGSGTFVVTILRHDKGASTYRPRHSSRDAGTVRAPMTSVTMPAARLDESQPLPIGDWQQPDRSRRLSRSWRGRKAG